MKSKLMPEFRAFYRRLPVDVQRQATAAYQLFKQNPFHPSLQFERVGKDDPIYSVRIGMRDPDDLITWYWIGPHAEYDKLVGQL